MGLTAYIGASFRCVITAGVNDVAPETNGYNGFGVGRLPVTPAGIGPFGSINKQPIPVGDLMFCASRNGGSNFALQLNFDGDIVSALSGKSAYLNGVLIPFSGWNYSSSVNRTSYTSAGDYHFVPGNQYLLEIRP